MMAQAKAHTLPSTVTKNLLEILLRSEEGKRQFDTITQLMGLKGDIGVEAQITIIENTPQEVTEEQKSDEDKEEEL